MEAVKLLPQYLFILNVYGFIEGLLLLYCKRGELNAGEMESLRLKVMI